MKPSLCKELEEYAKSSYITSEEYPHLKRFQEFITSNPYCFDRSNTGHITSSVWVVNYEKTKVLLTHHKKLGLWLQLGGHNDGNPDCKQVALQEAQEESGIHNYNFLLEHIFDIDIHPIASACAYHYDVRYLLQAPPGAHYAISEESHDLAWVSHDDLKNYTQERSVLRLHEKFKQFFL